jgi:hypothetical protein
LPIIVLGKSLNINAQIVEFVENDRDKIVFLTSLLVDGEMVWKLGIRTHLMSGSIYVFVGMLGMLLQLQKPTRFFLPANQQRYLENRILRREFFRTSLSQTTLDHSC